MVHELAPAGGEQVAPRRASVDVAELPYDAVDVGDGENLDRRFGLEVERREDGIGAEPRNGESAAVVGIGRRENLGVGYDLIAITGDFIRRISGGGETVWGGMEEELGENLVGDWIGEELDVGELTV